MEHDIVRTRPLVAGDAAALTDFYLGLSPLTLHARFFVDALSDPAARGLTSLIDQHNHMAVVAERISRRRTEIIGVARAIVTTSDATCAEFAIVVDDDAQSQGHGTALVKRLALDSWRRGVVRWRIVRLTGNDRVDRLLSQVAVCESAVEEAGVVDAVYRLVPALAGTT